MKKTNTARVKAVLALACALCALLALPLSSAFAKESAPTPTPKPTAVPSLYAEMPEPCDVLLVVAHPEDTALFFPGVLAATADKGMSVRVICLSEGRSEEARALFEETLEAHGVQDAPDYLGLGSIYYETREHAGNNASVDKLVRTMTELIRKYRPAYIVTHDTEGEFGHGLHILAAELVTRACAASYNPKKLTNSVKTYGAFGPKRIYYHAVTADGAVTLKRTAADDADTAAMMPLIEKPLDVSANSCTQPFYLAEIAPGADGTDEGLFGEGPLTTEEADGSAAAQESAEESAEASAPAEAAQTAAPSPTPEPLTNDFGGVFTGSGEAEQVVVNDPEGHWEYHGENLAVVIDHYETRTEENIALAYNVAHVYMRNEDAFVPGLREGKAHEYPWYMARRYGAVLAITGDNMTVAEGKSKGVIIRAGKVYNDRAGADTLAMLPDGSLKIYKAGTVTASDLLAEGIQNTFSFGPTLITGGVIQHEEIASSKVERKNPRVAIGMVEPGHLVIIEVDGRQSNYSSGITLEALATLFWTEGCTEAYNLDGGRSAALVFMGEHINRHEGSGSDVQRALPDALMWGHSDLVPSVTDPVWNTGNGPRTEPYIPG